MLDNLKPACGSNKVGKRKGRGQGSGMGKTASRGHGGYKSRSGAGIKPGFEGGQQPIYKRLPKIGFKSRFVKPFSISVDRFPAVKEMDEITVEKLKEAKLAPKDALKVKLIGKEAKDLAGKIKDENVTYTGK
jgi:large subunit ribosomal protein L15